jgi:heptosyltransferase-3
LHKRLAVIKRIILSRVDSLGDVVLTLPMAGVLKEILPDCRVIFLGNNYTAPLIGASKHVDQFVSWDSIKHLAPAEGVEALRLLKADVLIHVFPRSEIARLAFKAKIPIRLGTHRRLYHWFYCNQKVKLARRASDIHESQLNLKLLAPLGAKEAYDLSEIPHYYGLENVKPLTGVAKELLSKRRFNLILHPKSKGSAREWGVENFSRLVRLLPREQYKVFITGTREDGRLLNDFLVDHRQDVVDMTGKLDLEGLMSFISCADGIVAASTGPLHIAAALGKYAIGLYAPMRPIHPGRWAPVGTNADFLVKNIICDACKKELECRCIKSIDPEEVIQALAAANQSKVLLR